MSRAFVVGWPIEHSRSPLIHGHWLQKHGLAGSYQRVAVPPEEIAGFLVSLGARGFTGGNVTIPHKEAAFAAVARRDAAAQAIGAVNTVWLESGVLVGGNTDAYGFAANLDSCAPGWSDRREALVLGAGGAARAVVHALIERGLTVRVVNRSLPRAEALAAAFGPGVSAHGEADLEDLAPLSDLLVNTTPLGMEGEPGPDLAGLPDHALVTDIVYVPLETPLLRDARARGLVAVDGLGMLLHQAVPGFERWFGVRPEVTEELRQIIVRDIANGH